MTVIDSITGIHFLDLLLRFLKFTEKFVNLHQMLHLVTDGFFIYVISAEIWRMYLYRFYIYHSLIFSKSLIAKHLFDCNLRSYSVMQFGTVLMGNNIAARGLQGEVRFE